MQDLIEELRQFNAARNWRKFHTPKNLAMALSVEAAELTEIFQWMTTEESQNLNGEDLQHLKEELADVFLYLLNLSDSFQIDLLAAARDKMKLNAKKYPI